MLVCLGASVAFARQGLIYYQLTLVAQVSVYAWALAAVLAWLRVRPRTRRLAPPVGRTIIRQAEEDAEFLLDACSLPFVSSARPRTRGAREEA